MTERVEIIVSVTGNASEKMRTFGTDATKAFQSIGGATKSAGAAVAGLGQSLTMLTAPLALAGAFGVKAFTQFEDVLAEIAARTGATGEQMDIVAKKALDMGAATVFSGTEAADAMLQLLASGFDLEETFAALPAVLDAAAAGALDLGYTADVVTDALAMWNLGAEDAMRVSDALARGAGASSAEINDLAQGLSNVGPIAAEFGLSIEDTVSVLAAFSERGIKGAEAGTQLRSMMTAMTKETPKVTNTWDKLGISLFDAQGTMRPLQTVMGELNVAMSKMTDQERISTLKTLGGAYGQMGLSVLTSSDAIGDMTDLMGIQADAATVAQARMGTLTGVTDSLVGSMEALMINVLQPHIENTVKPFILQVTELVNTLNQWAMANPELVSQIVKVSAALIGLGPILFGAGKGIEIAGDLMIGFGKTTSMLMKLIPLLISPIGLLGVAAVALAVAWKKNLFGIQDFVKNALIPFQSWIDVFTAKFGQLGAAIMSGDLETAMIWAKDIFETFVLFLDMEILPNLSKWANDMVDTLVKWITDAIPIITAQLLTWASAFINWVAPFIPVLLVKLGELVTSIISWLGEIVPKIVDQLRLWGKAFIAWVGPQIPILLVKLGELVTRAISWIGVQVPIIVKKLGEWGDAFAAWVAPALADLLLALPGLFFGLINWILMATPGIIAQLLNWAAAFVDWIGPTIQVIIERLGVLMGDVINWIIVEFIPAIIAEGPGLSDALVGFVNESITKVGPALSNFLGSVLGFFVNDLLPGVFNAAKYVGDQIVDGIEAGVTAAWGAFETWITDKITGGIIGDVIGGIGSALDIEIPGFASGGSFSGLASVGEQGREYVYAPGGAMVLPNGLTEQLMSGQGNTYNLNTNTSATSAGVQQDFRMMEAFAG